jgi:hypothetical protein
MEELKRHALSGRKKILLKEKCKCVLRPSKHVKR